jgi:hypothetical protein
MRDVVYLATVIVFFAVAVLYVRACAALAGGDGDVVDVDVDGSSVELPR